jgi:uncharacterized protein YggE
MKIVRIAALVAAGLGVVAFAGALEPRVARAQADPPGRSLTVVGSGSVDIVPDRVAFGFGTVIQARTAASALEASSTAIARIVAALRREGIAQRDLQTQEVSLSPRWNEAGETIIGYTATNTVTATIRRLEQAGAVIDAAVAAGANQLYGPHLLTPDQASAHRDALRAAVADARTKAQALAAASGLALGTITAIEETGTTPSPMPGRDAAATSVAEIEPGTQDVSASVSVTFALG